jgi:hypothetical protein
MADCAGSPEARHRSQLLRNDPLGFEPLKKREE